MNPRGLPQNQTFQNKRTLWSLSFKKISHVHPGLLSEQVSGVSPQTADLRGMLAHEELIPCSDKSRDGYQWNPWGPPVVADVTASMAVLYLPC